MSYQQFSSDIERFNAMYKLQAHDQPTLLGADRVRQFHNIIAEEVEEGLDLAAKYEALEQPGQELAEGQKLEVLTELSDWLGDIVVYCASEAKRWGLPLDQILEVIMKSNFSKLGSDGEPIYDERGKVMKGPSYWKPEPRLSELLAKFTHGE